MLFGCSEGRVRVQGWGKGIFSLFTRTELSEIYGFPLGFWKWRLWGRIVFYVLIVERPFGAESSNDFVFGEGCPCSPWPLRTEGWKCLSLIQRALCPKLGRSGLCPLLWSCLSAGWESSKYGSTLWEGSPSMVHWVVRRCACEAAGTFMNVHLSVAVHLCIFLSLPLCGVCQCMPCAYWLLFGMTLKAAWTHPIHSVGFVCLNLTRWLQLLSVSQSVQNLDFCISFPSGPY